MNKTGWILAVLIIPILAGCQQTQQQNKADISRKDRLLADENMRLRSELVQYQNKLNKQEKTLEQYRQENKKMTKRADDAVGENQSLKMEIAQCRQEIVKQKKLLEQYQQMLDSKDAPSLCRNKIERQKKLLAQCKQENERIQIEAGETSSFLMEQLPAEMMKEIERLSQENEQLKARIEELEKTPMAISRFSLPPLPDL